AKKFAHRDGSAALLPHHFEIAHLLRRQRVLCEKQAVLLQIFHQIDSLDGLDTLVDIVDQFDTPAVYLPYILEQVQTAGYVLLVVLVLVGRQTESCAFEIRCLPKQRRAVPSELNTHMLPPRFHEFTDIVGSLFNRFAVRMTICRYGKPALAAQKLIKGH